MTRLTKRIIQGLFGAGRGGAGQGSKSPGQGGARAGQNMNISADLDHLHFIK